MAGHKAAASSIILGVGLDGSPCEELPDEVLLGVLAHLTPRVIGRAAQVCLGGRWRCRSALATRCRAEREPTWTLSMHGKPSPAQVCRRWRGVARA